MIYDHENPLTDEELDKLGQEDFDKFLEALKGTVDHVKTELMPEVDFTQFKDRDERGEKTEKEDETPAIITTTTDEVSNPDDELKWD